MVTLRMVAVAMLALGAAAPWHALAQARPDPATLIAAQCEAMRALAFMDGVWRGTAWTLLPTGQKHSITQTERIGPFLDGTIRIIEGRGYGADGAVTFNAFGVVSYSPDQRAYSMRSYAHGRAGDFALTPSADGFVWEIPAGPTTIRYTATVRNGAWREVGERLAPDRGPVQFFEMNLTRVGDSDWPAAGAIGPK